MRKGLWNILFWLTAVATVSLTGCDRREIVCLEGKQIPLEVAFEWDSAPDADPEGMTLYLYDADNREGCRRVDISGREGGRFELPVGRYNMIAVNNDLPGVRIEGYEKYNSICAATRSAANIPGQELPHVKPTGMLYGAVVNDIEVTICGVKYRRSDGSLKECPLGMIRCAPDSLSKEYHLVLRNVNGADRILSAKGVLSGMATELQLCDEVAGPEACCVSFPLESVGTGSGVLHGLTSGFGAPEIPDAAGGRFEFTAIVRLKNGKTYSKTFDVSDQVGNFLHNNTIIIIIDGIDIPDNPQEEVDDGFDVDVSGWNTVVIEL